MKIIEEIVDYMDNTLDEAEAYAIDARIVEEKYPMLAGTYRNLANQHLQHYQDLHTAVVQIINKYRQEKGEPPADMKDRYEYLHERAIRRYTKIKNQI